MERVAFRVSIAFLLAPLMLAAQDTTSMPFTISGYVTTSYTSSAGAIGDTIIVGRAYDRRNNTFLINIANLRWSAQRQRIGLRSGSAPKRGSVHRPRS